MFNKKKKDEKEYAKKILGKAIRIAEKNGYKGHLKYLPLFLPSTKKLRTPEVLDKLANDIFYSQGWNIMFSPGFAKNFWKKPEVTKDTFKDWKYHLIEMGRSKNPIKYLEKYVEK